MDLYLLGLALPDGNGLVSLKEWRRDTDQGVIILTGRSSEIDHVVGLEVGADDYVGKPFRIRELCARVNALYRRTAAPRAEMYAGTGSGADTAQPGATDADFTFEGSCLSLAQRALNGPDGGEIDLTTAKFNLLAELFKRRGRVLSREQIMNVVKGREWESYDRAVDGLVSRLRRKLSDGSADRLLHGLCVTRLWHGVSRPNEDAT